MVSLMQSFIAYKKNPI